MLGAEKSRRATTTAATSCTAPPVTPQRSKKAPLAVGSTPNIKTPSAKTPSTLLRKLQLESATKQSAVVEEQTPTKNARSRPSTPSTSSGRIPNSIRASGSPLSTTTIPLVVDHEEMLQTPLHSHRPMVEHFLDLLHQSRRCVVVTGAGISVSGGIPDFRSFDGLYNLVKAKYPGAVVKGRDLFDAHLFKDPVSTRVFYTFMGELKEMVEKASVTAVHHFLQTLQQKKKLLRCYTQNIDCMEERLGMRCAQGDKNGHVVLLHGSLSSVICTLCKYKSEYTLEYREVFKSGQPPACPECSTKNEVRVAANRRSIAVGTLRPDIILYNEHHAAGDAISECVSMDLQKRPNVLLVMGTSLKVHGIKKLVKDMAKAVKSNGGKVVLINKTPLQSTAEWKHVFDFVWLGDGDAVVRFLEKGLGERDRHAEERRKKREAIKAAKENLLDVNQCTLDKDLHVVHRSHAAGKVFAGKEKEVDSGSAASTPQVSPKKIKADSFSANTSKSGTARPSSRRALDKRQGSVSKELTVEITVLH